ncbi:hypothetical protein B0T21DRAFT_374591 [Apiosordaria backusii]|uniref:AGC-kinase C-terminal domain-containing protein n=1 Tax=Apiosordaria backusii TaxID=314023 RepID=A0AA40DWJ9_9PEZI|nr:hypothetical protein B0T21DRAFT_374591 [Apiosordaria backusii]
MLSHLRFHRRAPSNPSSPTPDQIATWEAAAHHDHPQTVQDISPRPDTRPDTRPRSPSSLQPLARVSSADADLGRPPTDNSQSPPARSAFDGNSTGFMGGVALHQYRRAMQESSGLDPQIPMATSLPEKRFSRTKAPPPPINTGLAARPALTAVKPSKSSKSSSFIAPTDLQLGSGGASSRPSGTRGSSDTALTQPSVAPPEPAPKGRKSLPFLRNSMSSLLLRRKTGHQPPEPQPVAKAPTQDVSIRGTRIHDFSAPRPKRVTPSTEGASSLASQAETPGFVDTPSARTDPGDVGSRLQETVSTEPIRSADGGWTREPASEETVPPVPPKDEPAMSVRTSSSATSAATTVGAGAQLDSKASVRTTASRSFSISKLSMRSSVRSAIPKHMKSTSSRFSFDMIGAAKQEKLLEERHRLREQEKKPADDMALGQRDSRFDDFDEDFDYDAMMEDDGFEEDIPCVSMDYDIEEEDPEAAADPDNDQENFAGFVFQRSNPASAVASPHSPGGMLLPTPRDANGTVIGYAMTKDTTPGLLTPAFPDPSALPKLEQAIDGLNIHPVDGAGELVVDQPAYRPTSLSVVESASVPVPEPAPKTEPQPVSEPQSALTQAPPPRRIINDDIYFDDGLADELDFTGDGFVIDESIFDNNDTDKYGRPIPGAFAQAQEAMRAAQLQASNRTSDMTSDLSGVSGAAASTGHTSVSAVAQQQVTAPDEAEQADPVSTFQPAPPPPEMLPFPGQDLAYQAALAEAAQKAAASGKFRRNSSPPPPAELTVTSPTDSTKSANNLDSALDDYEKEVNFDDYEKEVNFDDYERADYDDFASGYEDDYDFDDDAIIAEANAEALANDSDGWYGQEFGFYSAPIPQPGYGHHNNNNGNNNSNGQSAALNAENLFSYANGGYFGPAGGLGRSKSGRIVCREPNLTPITERSEYSNRNSIMSLNLPPVIGSDRNSLTINSPGLAQLALLGDDESGLSVAAYMKARNRAFGAGGGGSQVSSREGSPKSERGPSESPFGGHLHAGSIGGHVRKGSAFSLWSNSDAGVGDGSGAASPVPQMAAFPTGAFNNNQGANGVNGVVVSPLPQRPAGIGGMDMNQMGLMGIGMGMGMFAPPPGVQLPVLVPSPAIPTGSGSAFACSPVLEDGEEDEGKWEEEEKTITVKGLAPALPVVEGFNAHTTKEEKEPSETGTNTIMGIEGYMAGANENKRPAMGHKHKGSADSISYTMADGDDGKRWVVERRRTGETGEVEILGREVLDGGRI